MRKTARDIKREQIAHDLGWRLIGTGIDVIAGGKRGPYTVKIDSLNRKEMERLIPLLLETLGRTPVEE